MRILITGIEGFVGRYLSRELLGRGYLVFGTFFASEEIEELRESSTLFSCDITDSEMIEEVLRKVKPDGIFHLAAQSSAAISFQDVKNTFKVNVNGTLNLLEGMKKYSPLAKLILITSCEVYGGVGPEWIPTNERAPLLPLSPYATSKACQDMLGYQYAKSFGLRIIRIRPFPHTGPGHSSVFAIPNFAKQIAEIEDKKQEPVIFVGNLDSKRDFTDVRDMVKAYVLAIEKGKEGECYNIGSEKSFSMKDVLDILLEMANVKIEVKHDAGRFRPLDVPFLLSDCSKFMGETSWKPEIQLKKTLQDVLEYWRRKIKEKK